MQVLIAVENQFASTEKRGESGEGYPRLPGHNFFYGVS
jgi:hypothetical protein